MFHPPGHLNKTWYFSVTMVLLTILKKLKLKEKEMRLLMLWVHFMFRHYLVIFKTLFHYNLHFRGLDNAGKTTILKKFNGEDVHTISPTLGFNIKTLEHNRYLRDRSDKLKCMTLIFFNVSATCWTYGMLAVRSLSVHIGEIILKAPTGWSGWSTV